MTFAVINKPNLNYIQSNPEFRTDIITDSDGTRIGKELIKIDSNKKNILILGPSFSFGQGVDYEDTYSFKLQKNFLIIILKMALYLVIHQN